MNWTKREKQVIIYTSHWSSYKEKWDERKQIMLNEKSKRAQQANRDCCRACSAWKGAVQMVTSKYSIQHIFRSVLICTERMWKTERCWSIVKSEFITEIIMCHKIKNALEKFHLLAEKLMLMYFIRAESIRGFNNKSKKIHPNSHLVQVDFSY